MDNDGRWMMDGGGHCPGRPLLAMSAGLRAAVTPPSFKDTLVAMVCPCGDADTNAAVAGTVLGAHYGASAIPQRARIERLADELLVLA